MPAQRGPRWFGAGVVILCFALYAAAFLLLEPARRMDTTAFMLVPIAAAAWWVGITGGLLATIALLALHSTLTAVLLQHAAPFSTLVLPGLPTTLVALAFAVAAGGFRLRDRQLVRALDQSTALQQQVSASEQRLRSIANNLISGTYSIRNGRFAYVNRTMATTFGYTPEEMIGRLDPYTLIHPDDRSLAEQNTAPLQHDERTARRFRVRGIRRDGAILPLEALEQVTTIDGQRTIVGTLIDRTREEADEARNRLQLTALREAPIGILITDPHGSIEWANPHAETLTGYPLDELIGMHTRQLGSGHQDSDFYHSLWTTVTNGKHWSGELINERKDGTEYREAMTITPVLDDQGTIEHFVAAKRDITEQTRARASIRALNASLQKQVNQLTALRDIDTAITAGTDLHTAASKFLDATRMGLDIDTAAIYTAQAGQDAFDLIAVQGLHRPLDRLHLPVDVSLVGQAEKAGRPSLLEGADRINDHFRATGTDFLTSEGLHLLAAAPLTTRGGLKGGLVVAHHQPHETDQAWLDFLQAIAAQGAILLDNATLITDLEQRNQELRNAYDATIEGWSRALDLRDHETEGHSQRVTHLTLQLARAMNLPDEDLIHIRRGALLHDIGKVGIPDAILQKPGKLTDEEWALMRTHPTLARDLLQPIRFLQPALAIPFSHHERWDGTGYPQGLRGEQIPLPARIFAIADVYDALTSDRPYRRAWTHERTITHIQQGSGSHFDPRVVSAFLELSSHPTQPRPTHSRSPKQRPHRAR